MSRTHDSDQTLHSLLVLFAAFEKLGLQYVLIGRRSRIRSTLAGEGDVDLLVGRVDGAKAKRVLLAQEFRQQTPHPWFRNHAVIDYIGRDGPTGRTSHVQLHHELRLGSSVTRAVRLPITDYLISTSVPEPPVRLPKPAAHLLLHSMKALLGMRRGLGRSAQGAFDREEFRLLLPLVSRDEVLETGRQMFPPLRDEVLDDVYDIAVASAQGFLDRTDVRVAALSRSVRKGLAEWTERPLPAVWMRGAYRRGLRRLGYQPPLDPRSDQSQPSNTG